MRTLRSSSRGVGRIDQYSESRSLDQWVKGTLPSEQFIRLYYRNWGMPWPLYRDILMYVREEGIPAVGVNLH